jgi:lipocalin
MKFLDDLKKIENDIIIKYYKNFVGEKELNSLVKQFDINKFCDKWQQVLTSRTTGLFGTGITFSSVQATYSLNDNGTIDVLNEAYNTNFENIKIKGISEARDNEIPTCRTVKFSTVPLEGNYWIIYISPSFNTIIVAAPLITPIVPIDISNNFGVYVLTKNRDEFWNSTTETNEVFNTLKKYGFTNFWNEPISSGKTFNI